MKYTYEDLDGACRELHALARKQGLQCIEVHVACDGLVRLYGTTPQGFTAWVVDGDVLPEGSLQRPSAALCDAVPSNTEERETK